MQENAPTTLGCFLICQKQDLMSLVWMDNVIVWARDLQVVCPNKDVFAQLTKLTLKLGTERDGCHQVDGYGVLIIFLGSIKDLEVFFAMFFKDMLGVIKHWGMNCHSQGGMWMT